MSTNVSSKYPSHQPRLSTSLSILAHRAKSRYQPSSLRLYASSPGPKRAGPSTPSSIGRRGENLHGAPGLHVERRGIDHVAVDVRGLRAAVLAGDGEAARAERVDAGDAELRG